jgi:signal transduction histidine kinase
MFGPQCRERSIRWIRGYDEEVEVPRVAFDREQIEQVLINILKNAIEAIGSDGSLEVRLRDRGPVVELQILDDGSGLDLETQGNLFSPFFSTKAQGQGLGLTLAKEILVKHGFDFGLEPAADGRTCFHLRIPLKAV